MWRFPTIVQIALLVSVPAFANDPKMIIATCAKNHSDKICYENSKADLETAERIVEESASNSGQHPDFIKIATDALSASNMSFELYRKQECDSHADIARSGNRTLDFSACLAELNDERSSELKWISTLPNDVKPSPPVKVYETSVIIVSCDKPTYDHATMSQCIINLADDSSAKLNERTEDALSIFHQLGMQKIIKEFESLALSYN